MSRREVEGKLAASTFSRPAAGVVATLVTIGTGAAAGAAYDTNPFISFGTIAIGAVLLGLALSAESKHKRILETGWTDYYSGSRWFTPAGETVTVVDANHDGTVVGVRFQDGECRNYPLWMLGPVDGFERVSGPEYTTSSNVLLMNVSKTRWKHLDGREGVVRGARRVEVPGEIGHVDYLELKMDGGVKEFERAYLTPI